METRPRRKVRRRRRNFYSSRAMTVEERRELARAQKLEGLGDEIAFMRMRLKKAHLEEIEGVEVLSLSLERLARIVATEQKLSGKAKGDPSLVERMIASIQAFEDQLGPIPESKFGGPLILPPEDGWPEE